MPLRLSVSMSVLRSGTEVIGSLVAVCLCVGSVSKLECFIVPVCQTAAVHQGPRIHHCRSQYFRAVAPSSFLVLPDVTDSDRLGIYSACGSIALT